MSQAMKFERQINRKTQRKFKQKQEGRVWKKSGVVQKMEKDARKQQDKAVTSTLTRAFNLIGCNAYVGFKASSVDLTVHQVHKQTQFQGLWWFNPNDQDASSDEDDFSQSTLSDNTLKRPFVVLSSGIDVEIDNESEESASLDLTLLFEHDEPITFHVERDTTTNDLTFTDKSIYERQQSEKQTKKSKKQARKSQKTTKKQPVFFFA